MPKKIFLLLFLAAVTLTGCRNSHQIENAAVIENVSVSTRGGQLYYTFYPLTDSEKPESVAVPAKSFEEARSLAASRYIPNMTLAKLELLLIETDVNSGVMRRDIEYISTQASISPVASVALCDEKTVELLGKETSAQHTIRRQIAGLKRDDPGVKTDYLSVFNSYAKGGSEGFKVPLITCDGELKVSERKIE